ncbi:MAG TPA: Slp family lipoprotein [Nitrospirota bacterium]|nr:Slp family lipoprotein [Nitrospirota bacterium]
MNHVFIFSALVLMLAQGCTYAISRDMVDQADKALTFEMLQADPASYKGKTIILGGVIAHITDTKKGTMLEVIQKPLDLWGKPKRTDRTGGRFLLITSVHLNTLLFTPDREITVACEIAGMRDYFPDELEYSYPVVLSKELKLWPLERQGWEKPQWVDPLDRPAGPPQSPSQRSW